MKKFLMIAALSVLALLSASQAYARAEKPSINADSLAQLPIMEGGRLKPLDSFAREKLRAISGATTYNGKPAIDWLAVVVFTPDIAATEKFFILENNAIKAWLSLPDQETRFDGLTLQERFASRQQQLLDIMRTAQPDAQQRELMRLQGQVQDYIDLLRSLSLLLPLPAELAGARGGDTYRDLAAQESQIVERLKKVIRRKGEDLSRYSDEEKKLSLTAFTLSQIGAGGRESVIWRVLPTTLPGPKPEDKWVSPWMTLSQGQAGPGGNAYLDDWESMMRAYRAGDQGAFDDASRAALKNLQPYIEDASLGAELFYNRIHPLGWALGFYGVALFSLLVTPWIKQARILQQIYAPALYFGAGAHALALGLRIWILQRPPVGTLYESVLFVSLICALLALGGSRRRDSASYLGWLGTAAAAGLLLLAPVVMPAEESMEMLVAVLNTRFWLTVHVLCITAGYGLCIITALLAQGWLWMGPRGPHDLFRRMHYFSLVSLLLTAVGTALGGIWADQSWGRFWGWDPKENGALLIVLWLAWLQHGRMSGIVTPRIFAAGLAFLNVVVALAWFGVNLLGVGLHSYGFTSGLALGLGVFCVVQMTLIVFLWRRHMSTHKAFKLGQDL